MSNAKSRMGTAKERSVFVGNIPYDVTEEMLKDIFSEVGPVLNFRLVTDRDTGKPKGYGFCEYSDGATALSAMRNLNGHEVNGRNLRVDFADGGEKQVTERDRSSGVTGEALIKSIESAIASQSRVALYDMLVAFQEYARTKPDATKHLLGLHPVLVHAIIECFKTLNISMTSLPPVLKTPSQPPPMRGSRSAPPPAGGILGLAPPTAMMHSMPPPQQSIPVQSSRSAARDPRAQRRDPRLSGKRDGGAMSQHMDAKRIKQEENVADMARGMTAEKLSLLPPNERQMLIAFMEQNGIPYSS
ncbi:unnamed protein product [Aphanomyces euteiches]|uniref:RRM domain-containing protein n=1 Tax=Aphanomyces euteiches TaxID=100861 RepID=A0A6G0WCC0_9STRA|nr:hypothetical protein Ae201684_016512 [Aphanomyces euteiches]KAH9093291.1 hypothetical protein Ae201684P_008947 [Aphanomyces euteiches]KAH9153176.1 hypothetical protein AeRB84_004516 [Aphanomyces euteiches]